MQAARRAAASELKFIFAYLNDNFTFFELPGAVNFLGAEVSNLGYTSRDVNTFYFFFKRTRIHMRKNFLKNSTAD